MNSHKSYKDLDKMYASIDADDRANRGVTLTGWVVAFGISAIFWGLIYLLA